MSAENVWQKVVIKYNLFDRGTPFPEINIQNINVGCSQFLQTFFQTIICQVQY